MVTLSCKHGRVYRSYPNPKLIVRFLDKIKETKLPNLLHPDLFSVDVDKDDRDRFDFYSSQFLGRQMVADFLYLEWDKYQEVPIIVTEEGVTVRSVEDYDVYHVVVSLKPYLYQEFSMNEIEYDDQFVYRFVVDKIHHCLYLIEVPLHCTKAEEAKSA